MKRAFLLALIATAPVVAQEAATPPAEPAAPAAEPEKVESLQLKHRSSFEVAADARPPFWPVGWVRRSAEAPAPVKKGEVPVVKAKLLPEHFSVSSVLLGSPALATINNRSFAEGESFPVSFDGRVIRLVLKSVRDGGVVLEGDEQQLYVPLRRAEIITRPSADPGTTSAPPMIIIPPNKGR